ncbi:MAG: uracil-DNA glycosylase [Pseudomonadota bacterium]
MGADLSNNSGKISQHSATPARTPSSHIRSEFLKTIQDFKGHLFSIKKENGFFPGISKESELLMNEWGYDSPGDLSGDLSGDSYGEDLFFSQGSETASIYILDSMGRFFKGKSGELLVKIMKAMSLSIDQVFICNVDDIKAVCKRIDHNIPKVIITLGSKAGKLLLNTDQSLESFRGKFFKFHGIQVMPTFHPSLLIKDAQYKRQVWEDMKQVMTYAGLNHDA